MQKRKTKSDSVISFYMGKHSRQNAQIGSLQVVPIFREDHDRLCFSVITKAEPFVD